MLCLRFSREKKSIAATLGRCVAFTHRLLRKETQRDLLLLRFFPSFSHSLLPVFLFLSAPHPSAYFSLAVPVVLSCHQSWPFQLSIPFGRRERRQEWRHWVEEKEKQSDRARERERKSEVLIRTLINLFCSDPSVGSSSDVRAWGRGEGEEKTRKIGNRAPIASRRE